MHDAMYCTVHNACIGDRPIVDTEYHTPLEADSSAFATWLAARKNFNSIRKARGFLPVSRSKPNAKKTRKPFRRRSKGPKSGEGPPRRRKSRRKGSGKSGSGRNKRGLSSGSHEGKGKSRDRPTPNLVVVVMARVVSPLVTTPTKKTRVTQIRRRARKPVTVKCRRPIFKRLF